MCARIFNLLLWLNTRGVHEQAAGCTFYEPVRPDGAQNKTLISNTGVPTAQEKQGKWSKTFPVRENTENLKVKDISIFAVKIPNLYFKLDMSTKSVWCM